MNLEELIYLIDTNLPENRHYQNLLYAINDWSGEINDVS